MHLLRSAIRKAFYMRLSQKNALRGICVGWCVSVYGQRKAFLANFENANFAKEKVTIGTPNMYPTAFTAFGFLHILLKAESTS